MAGLNITFQRLPDMLSGRSTTWPDMSYRKFNIIIIFFALCMGTSTRNARLEIQHAVNQSHSDSMRI